MYLVRSSLSFLDLFTCVYCYCSCCVFRFCWSFLFGSLGFWEKVKVYGTREKFVLKESWTVVRAGVTSTGYQQKLIFRVSYIYTKDVKDSPI